MSVYPATPAQITSLQDLESQAGTNTIQDHSLSPGDTEAVENWACPDADAELWGLLVQAINAVGAGTATSDQQNADAWLTTVIGDAKHRPGDLFRDVHSAAGPCPSR